MGVVEERRRRSRLCQTFRRFAVLADHEAAVYSAQAGKSAGSPGNPTQTLTNPAHVRNHNLAAEASGAAKSVSAARLGAFVEPARRAKDGQAQTYFKASETQAQEASEVAAREAQAAPRVGIPTGRKPARPKSL